MSSSFLSLFRELVSRSFLVRSFQADGTPVMKTVAGKERLYSDQASFFAEKRTPDRRLRLSGIMHLSMSSPEGGGGWGGRGMRGSEIGWGS